LHNPNLEADLSSFYEKTPKTIEFRYGSSISSLSTLDFVPFEYSDAGGHVTDGKFTIDTPHLLN